MTDWPDNLKVAPIREWPGEQTRRRQPSPFRGARGKITPLSVTTLDLKRELREVRAKNAELLVAIPAEKFRLDGKPYANATASHPGVILSFEIPNVGRVSYPCDAFFDWESNLRGIVLALESLRRVNRYGVVKHNEQYRGFLALEATAAPAGFSSIEDVSSFLRTLAGTGEGLTWLQWLRRAQRETHPDRGGDAAIFQRVSLAEAKLREAGML
jgi:hypothetical protein